MTYCTPHRSRASGGPKQFGQMQREMDRWFDDVFGFGVRGEQPKARSSWYAPLTLWEDGEHFHVEVELPGVLAEDVHATIENGALQIEAERKQTEVEDRKIWHEERRFGSVVRKVALPETVDEETIQANLRDGVLSIQIAKRPETKPKKIDVKVQ